MARGLRVKLVSDEHEDSFAMDEKKRPGLEPRALGSEGEGEVGAKGLRGPGSFVVVSEKSPVRWTYRGRCWSVLMSD